MTLKLNKTIEKWESMWYFTNFPEDLIIPLEKDLNSFGEDEYQYGTVGRNNQLDDKIRKNKVCWLSTSHWVSAFIHYYLMKANEENFHYNITDFSDDLQYSFYDEGEYYNWHIDGGLINPDSLQRKLSFSLQLSDGDEYVGGNLQFQSLDGLSTYYAPREKGTLIIFDSRLRHRVTKILSGRRKSLVGWVNGPRWK